MRIIDVSLTLSDKLPVWPGDPRVSLERVRKIEDGANSNVSHLDMQVHTGTHIDAPVHFLQGGTGVDRISLPELIGPCFVVEIPPDSGNITAEILESTHIPSGITRLLMKTSNSDIWERGDTEFNTGFVGLAEDGAKLLVC